MIKIFLTADNHFGRKFDRYPIKDIIIANRYDSFEKMIKKANEEKCNFFVIAGDLFENTNNIATTDVKKVIDYLKKFEGNVLVLPGNHDYYTGEEMIWKTFEKNIEGIENITLLKEYKEYKYEVGEEAVVFFPAYCDAKHSDENKLSAYKDYNFDDNDFNVLIAHGAIEGKSVDNEGKYFLMAERELNNMGVDCCLIGHMHVPYPENLKEEEYTKGYKVFNAGTHSQLDLHNNTDGECFIIELSGIGENKEVKAKKYCSGELRFYDLNVDIYNNNLKESVKKSLDNIATDDKKKVIVRINVNGSISTDEYEKKEDIYNELLGDYLYGDKEDKDLVEQITMDKIKKEFAETSFASQLLERLSDNPIEQRITYDLIKEAMSNENKRD